MSALQKYMMKAILKGEKGAPEMKAYFDTSLRHKILSNMKNLGYPEEHAIHGLVDESREALNKARSVSWHEKPSNDFLSEASDLYRRNLRRGMKGGE